MLIADKHVPDDQYIGDPTVAIMSTYIILIPVLVFYFCICFCTDAFKLN